MSFVRRLDDFLLASLVVAVADLCLFHLGAYYPLLQPSSHSGDVMRQQRRFARSVEDYPGRDRIVVMGNSTAAACIQESQLESELAEAGRRAHVINMAIGSSTPRSWLLLLDNGRLTADNTAVVVLGLGPSSIQASGAQGPRDLKISKTHLRIRDALTIARTCSDLEMQLMAFSSAFFRTTLFREDLRQYQHDPWERHRQLQAAQSEESGGARRENRSRRDISSARLGDDGKIVFDELPRFLKKKDQLRANIERSLQLRRQFLADGGLAVPAAKSDPRRLATISRLVERLNAEDIQVVFSVVPRSAYPLGTLDASGIEDLYQALRRRGAKVALWHDDAMIRELESPRLYRDRLHVNADGAKIYTRGLARFLALQDWTYRNGSTLSGG